MKSYMIINTMNSLFEQLVLNKEQFENDEGIAFLCTIDSECLGFEKDGNTRHANWQGRSIQYVHVIMLKRHQIFVHISRERPFHGELPQSGWLNTSNHNSCWRDGCRDITDLGFRCWDEAHSNCPKENRPATRDDRVNFDLRLSVCGDLFKLVKVTKEAQGDGYHYEITKVEALSSKLTK